MKGPSQQFKKVCAREKNNNGWKKMKKKGKDRKDAQSTMADIAHSPIHFAVLKREVAITRPR